MDRRYYSRQNQIVMWLQESFSQSSYKTFAAFGHLWVDFESREDLMFFQLKWV